MSDNSIINSSLSLNPILFSKQYSYNNILVYSYNNFNRDYCSNFLYLIVSPSDTDKLANEIISLINSASSTMIDLPVCNFPVSINFIQVPDWNNMLSPWSAPKVFGKGQDFSGLADSFLDTLTTYIIPLIENEYFASSHIKRFVGGYSMGGLFASYACLNSQIFDGLISMSGSLWYDDFIDYACRQCTSLNIKNAYISLGNAEHKTKNSRMANVLSATQEFCNLLINNSVHVTYRTENGNHFKDIPKRIARGILTTLQS